MLCIYVDDRWSDDEPVSEPDGDSDGDLINLTIYIGPQRGRHDITINRNRTWPTYRHSYDVALETCCTGETSLRASDFPS